MQGRLSITVNMCALAVKCNRHTLLHLITDQNKREHNDKQVVRKK